MSDAYSLGKKKAVRVAKKVARGCDAYQKFLKRGDIHFSKTRFSDLPLCEKKNYTQSFPLAERIYKGKKLSDFYMICTSSGSIDEPTIWPRSFESDQKIEMGLSKFLDNNFQIFNKKTLIVVALALGTTQAGVMNLRDSWSASKKAKVSVISPNGDTGVTLFLLEKLAKFYDQVIFLGYPPLISDVLDSAVKKKLPVRDWSLKIALTSESISPLWRCEVLEITGGKEKDIVSFYGTTEAGIIGFETPETNAVISRCLDNAELRFALFGTRNLPTLVAVDFSRKFVEIVGGEVVVTVDQVVPLVRYNVHDNGMLISSAQINQVLKKHGLKRVAFKKENTYLAIFGRNLQRRFSIEDIRHVLDAMDIYDVLLHEFQFQEKVIDSQLKLTLYLYQKSTGEKTKKDLAKTVSNEVVRRLNEVTRSNEKFVIDVVMKEENEAIGYKMGKLRYLLGNS